MVKSIDYFYRGLNFSSDHPYQVAQSPVPPAAKDIDALASHAYADSSGSLEDCSTKYNIQ